MAGRKNLSLEKCSLIDSGELCHYHVSLGEKQCDRQFCNPDDLRSHSLTGRYRVPADCV